MISIIIPSYNSEDTIIGTLNALHHQTFDGEYEIIVVDSSNDRTPEIIRQIFPKVHLIHLKTKTDPFKARNIGIDMAKGNLIAFLDADCVAVPDWLKCIVANNQLGYKIIGGVVINGNDPKDEVALAGYMCEFREFIPCEKGKEVPHIPSCNIAYQADIIKKYGKFNDRFHPLRSSPGIQQGDLIYNYRIHQNGERIFLDPRSIVYHHHRSKFRDFLRHERRLGRCTSGTLKILDLPGKTIARNPILAIFATPLLPFIKFFRTFHVFMNYDPKLLVNHPKAFLIFLIGLFAWAIGFIQGAIEDTYDGKDLKKLAQDLVKVG